MNKFMPLLTLDNKPLVLKGDGGQQPATLTIKTEGVSSQSGTINYVTRDGTFSGNATVSWNSDVVIETIVGGVVSISKWGYSIYGQKDVSGVIQTQFPSEVDPKPTGILVTAPNAAITIYNND